MTRAAAAAVAVVAVKQQNSRKHQPQQLRQPYQVTQWSDSGKPMEREGNEENDAVFIAYSAFEKLWCSIAAQLGTGVFEVLHRISAVYAVDEILDLRFVSFFCLG